MLNKNDTMLWIYTLIGAGIGFAIGDCFHFLWGIYGAILGVILLYNILCKYYDGHIHYKLKMTTSALVGVGLGFAIGDYFSFLWGVFGAVLGGLIGFRIFMK